jgi:hypothetical protein
MADWQIGDLALYIKESGEVTTVWNPIFGHVYTIDYVYPGGEFVELAEDPEKFDPVGSWASDRFVRITPGADIEGIEVERKAPVKERV